MSFIIIILYYIIATLLHCLSFVNIMLKIPTQCHTCDRIADNKNLILMYLYMIVFLGFYFSMYKSNAFYLKRKLNWYLCWPLLNQTLTMKKLTDKTYHDVHRCSRDIYFPLLHDISLHDISQTISFYRRMIVTRKCFSVMY